jgi:type I restriction enzyme S subunit
LNGYSYSDTTTSQNNIFNKGDILFGKLRPNLKKSIKADFDGCCSGEILVIKTISSELSQSFLQFIFQDERIYNFCESLVAGTKMPRVSWTDLSKFEVTLPSVNEQKKIAEILTSVDRVIELTSMEIDKLKDLKKGMMQELLTKGIGHSKFKDSPVGRIPESWGCLKLGELAAFRNGLNYNASNAGTGIKVISVGDFKDFDHPKYESVSEINPKGIVSLDDLLKENDFLFVRSNGNRQLIGRSMMIKELNGIKVSFSGFVIRCRINNFSQVMPDFMKNIFKSGLIRDAISDEGAGTNISNLNQQILSNLDIVVPPAAEQIEITKLLDGLNLNLNLKECYRSKVELLKKSLMNDLLTGKIRVKCA